jgi:hypothetical protein
VLIDSSALAAGVVNARFCAALLTVTAFCPVAPKAVAVKVSTPDPDAVSVTVPCPEEFVVMVDVLSVLYWLVIVTVCDAMPTEAESFSVMVYVAVEPYPTESCPLTSMVVPTTDTVFVLLMEPQDEVTVMMRFDLSSPMLRVAVA